MEKGAAQIPLLQFHKTHQQTHHNHQQNHRNVNNNNNKKNQQQEIAVAVVDAEDEATLLDKTLKRLEFHLTLLGFDQTSILSFLTSWIVFLLMGVVVPMLIFELTPCNGCKGYRESDFEYDALTSQALLCAVSLICVSHNIRKRGIRKFLFVDHDKGHTLRFMDQYIQKIKGSYYLVLWSLLPCGFLKLVHEVIRITHVQNLQWWQASLIVSLSVISWTYLSAVTLVACNLFHMACSLQVIHFKDYYQLLETEPNVFVLMTKHFQLRHYLSKISHRFRIYLLLMFLIITSALCVTLVQITSTIERVTFLNGGNLAVTSIVQVAETVFCLHAGTKISSKAQAIGSKACKWHASVTNGFFEGTQRSHSADSINRSISMGSLSINFSESDLESLNSFSNLTRTQVAPTSSYNQRQSFVMYLQANPGGITLYGWTVDRSLLTTIFFIELTLITFVLGQTIIFTPTST